MPILEVEHIRKYFERTEVLKDISFSLEQGQVGHAVVQPHLPKQLFCMCFNLRMDVFAVRFIIRLLFCQKLFCQHDVL